MSDDEGMFPADDPEIAASVHRHYEEEALRRLHPRWVSAGEFAGKAVSWLLGVLAVVLAGCSVLAALWLLLYLWRLL